MTKISPCRLKKVSWQCFLIGMDQRFDLEIKYGMERCTSDPKK